MLNRRDILKGMASSFAVLNIPAAPLATVASSIIAPPAAAAITPAMIVPPSEYFRFNLLGFIQNAEANDRTPSSSLPSGFPHNTNAVYPRNLFDHLWPVTYTRDVLERGLSNIVTFMQASRIGDLTDLSANYISQIDAVPSGSRGSISHGATLKPFLSKFASPEAARKEAFRAFEDMKQGIFWMQKNAPSRLTRQSLDIDKIGMYLRIPYKYGCTNLVPTFQGYKRGYHSDTHYYHYTETDLKFLVELAFLEEYHFLPRVFPLPEHEQSVLDTLEANPTSWSVLLHLADKATVDRLTELYPDRTEKSKAYIEAVNKIGLNAHDYPVILTSDNLLEMKNGNLDICIKLLHETKNRTHKRNAKERYSRLMGKYRNAAPKLTWAPQGPKAKKTGLREAVLTNFPEGPDFHDNLLRLSPPGVYMRFSNDGKKVFIRVEAAAEEDAIMFLEMLGHSTSARAANTIKQKLKTATEKAVISPANTALQTAVSGFIKPAKPFTRKVPLDRLDQVFSALSNTPPRNEPLLLEHQPQSDPLEQLKKTPVAEPVGELRI